MDMNFLGNVKNISWDCFYFKEKIVPPSQEKENLALSSAAGGDSYPSFDNVIARTAG